MSAKAKIDAMRALDDSCIQPGAVSQYLGESFPIDDYQASVTTALFDCGGIYVQIKNAENEKPQIDAYLLMPDSHGNIYQTQATQNLIHLNYYRHRKLEKVQLVGEKWLNQATAIAERRLNGWLLRQGKDGWNAPWEPDSGGYDEVLYWVNPHTNKSHHRIMPGGAWLGAVHSSLKRLPSTPPMPQQQQPWQVNALQQLGADKEHIAVVNSMVRTRPELDGEQVAEEALQILRDRRPNS